MAVEDMIKLNKNKKLGSRPVPENAGCCCVSPSALPVLYLEGGG